jgi:hypothetical protein
MWFASLTDLSVGRLAVLSVSVVTGMVSTGMASDDDGRQTSQHLPTSWVTPLFNLFFFKLREESANVGTQIRGLSRRPKISNLTFTINVRISHTFFLVIYPWDEQGTFWIFDFCLGRIFSLIFIPSLLRGAAGFSPPSDTANIDGWGIRAVETLLS